jgi:squalene synthase HpnC
MPVDHYENFPVASVLLPARLRPAVQAIYAFARGADDAADEGQMPDMQRLAALARYHAGLQSIAGQARGLPHDDPLAGLFTRLAHAIHKHQLPLQPFFDLLSAFEQDVTVKHYPHDAALQDYCRRSANPVGRLMLHLYGAATPENQQLSDAICTGLQLTNFWQDVVPDWQKGRIYLPQDALDRHGIRTHALQAACEGRAGFVAAPGGDPGTDPGNHTVPPGWPTLMAERCTQARKLLLQGAPLATRLPGRIGLELRLVVLGGLRILEKLDTVNYDMFGHRPTLGRSDWLLLVWRAAHYQRYTQRLAAQCP